MSRIFISGSTGDFGLMVGLVLAAMVVALRLGL